MSKQAQKLRAAIAECKEIISEHERYLREYENMLYELEHGDESDRDKAEKDFEFFFDGEDE